MQNKISRLFVFLLGMMVLLGSGIAAVNAATPMVAAGWKHSVGLSTDGSVYGWGSDLYGQLGLGRPLLATVPQAVPGLSLGPESSSSRVAAGWAHNLVAKPDGTVWAWGRNDSGEPGDGTTANRTSPVQVPGLTGVVAVAAANGGGSNASHSIAAKSDGTVWAWGRNVYGQIGDGTTTDRATPVQVAGLSEMWIQQTSRVPSSAWATAPAPQK